MIAVIHHKRWLSVCSLCGGKCIPDYADVVPEGEVLPNTVYVVGRTAEQTAVYWRKLEARAEQVAAAVTCGPAGETPGIFTQISKGDRYRWTATALSLGSPEDFGV